MIPTATTGPADAELLGRFLRGDDAALGLLARRYEPAMLGLARSLLFGRADLAQDAVQDTWLRVIRAASTYSGEAAVKTWLYRILVNRCHDLRAQAKRHAPREPDPSAAAPEPPRAPHADPTLQRAIDGLPDDRRDILILCYHRGLTHEHAASVLGIPLGTLKSRLHAALAELRTILAPGTPHEPQ